MSLEPITLKSGHILELGTPDFSQCKRLFKTVARELAKVDIHLEEFDVKTLEGLDVSILIKAALKCAGSDEVDVQVMACASRSLLQGQKITEAAFEPADMRRDYLPVVWEVMKLALTPFFADLVSVSPLQKKGDAPKPRIVNSLHPLDLVSLRLVKEGMGSWHEVESMPVDDAMNAFHYCVTLTRYSETQHELMKDTKK